MVKAPLYEALLEYSTKNKSFHMPGHKFGSFGEMKSLDLTALDATEASGLDNLYEAEGIILKAMEQMAKYYGAQETLFLTNGSTAGVIASLLAVCKEGDQVMVARNCHHSVWSALILGGIEPIYIEPEYDEQQDILTVIHPKYVKAMLEQNPKVKGLIMVSPTYEGVTSDIKQIAKYLHDADKILIVDEAHGSHFATSTSFPTSALQLGADIVVQSMHKTLPTLTQSALIHRGSQRVSHEALVESLRMIQTSSPSYMMMAIMDYMRAYLEEHKVEIEKSYVSELKEARARLMQLKRLKLVEVTDQPYDIGKIVISTRDTNQNGQWVAQILEEKYNIISEAVTGNTLILMTTLADNKETLTGLVQALMAIDTLLETTCQKQLVNPYRIFKTIKQSDKKRGYLPRKAHYSQKEDLAIDECEGRINASTLMLYPPGIPILCVGECITKEHIVCLKQYSEWIKGISYIDGEMMCKVVRES